MGRYAILCEGLRKTYPGRPPVVAVRGIDFSVRPGECFGVLGPNGAGKTTTIEILEGLLAPTEGRVEILGRRWEHDADAIRQRIGISLQETRFSDRLTVREILVLFRSFYRQGLDPDQVIAQVELEEKAGAWIKNLSGGQKQRVALAASLVGDPELLFLDEPTTGLDPTSRRGVWQIVQDFVDRGRTVLLTTHYMDEAERLCDRVAIVDHGKIIALGTPHELIASVGGPHVITFSCESDTHQGPSAEELAGSLPGVTSLTESRGEIQLTVREPHVTLPALLSSVERYHLRLVGLTTRHASLEDVFVQITGRHFEEQQASDDG